MSDTLFTASPHWSWLVVLYFFVGGIAGGAFFLSAVLHFFGRPEDRPVIHLGHYVALAGAVLSGILLTLDLTRPLRFWHMLVESNTGSPMFKAWSPMSVGAWGLALFGALAALAAAGSWAKEERHPRIPGAVVLARPWVRGIISVLGGSAGFFLAGYTGVLLSVTNRPIWADSSLVGLLFLVSGASTGAALLGALAARGGASVGCIEWLADFDRRAIMVEIIVLAAFLFSLGSVARLFVGWWGLLLVVGVIGLGLLLPLMIESSRATEHPRLLRAAPLVLLGGLLLRVVIVFSSNAVHVAGSTVSLP